MTTWLMTIGLAVSFATLVALLWSIALPERRIWPPKSYGPMTPVMVWGPTATIYLVIVALGVLDWGAIAFPAWLRYGIGLPVIVLTNIAVWYEVAKFGMRQTGGAEGTLRTDGLYRYSRNPQYVADALMIAGWLALCASWQALPVGLFGIVLFLIAPLAEEPWMKQHYGKSYTDYMTRVRRYL